MEIFIYIIMFIIGTLFGSFLTLAVYRIPKKENIIYKHSYCPNCNHKLGFFDMIPILSYIFLRGRCRYCNNKIRIRYLLLEIISGLCFLTLFMFYRFNFYYIEISKIITFVSTILSIVIIILISCIEKENKIIAKPVLITGIIFEAIYSLYLYFVKHININLFILVLIIEIILFILENIILKNKAKKIYAIEILEFCVYIFAILNNISDFIVLIIVTLIVIALYGIIINLNKSREDTNILNEKNTSLNRIPIGFIIGFVSVAFIIINTYLIYR